MALGPSIFLPCNHSGAFYIFKSAHSIIEINKLMQKIFYISFDSLIVIVSKWQNMIEQSYRSFVDRSLNQWRCWWEAFTLNLFPLRFFQFSFLSWFIISCV